MSEMTIVVEKTNVYDENCPDEVKKIAEVYFFNRKFKSLKELTSMQHDGRLIFGNYLLVGDARVEKQVAELPDTIEAIVNELPILLKKNPNYAPLFARYQRD